MAHQTCEAQITGKDVCPASSMRLEGDYRKEEEELKDDEGDDLRGTLCVSEGCHQGFDDHDDEQRQNIVYPAMAIGSGKRGYPLGGVGPIPFSFRQRSASGEERGRKQDCRESNEEKNGQQNG